MSPGVDYELAHSAQAQLWLQDADRGGKTELCNADRKINKREADVPTSQEAEAEMRQAHKAT